MTLEQAKKLFENQEYTKCVNACTELFGQTDNIRELCTLTVKALLYVSKPPMSDENIEVIFSSAQNAVAYCTTLKEYYDTVYEIDSEINKYHLIYTALALQNLQDNPCLEQYQRYNPCEMKFCELKLYISAAKNNRPKWNDMLEKEGLTAEEAEEKYYREPEPDMTKEQSTLLEYANARAIYDKAKNYLYNNLDGNEDLVLTVNKAANSALLTAKILLDGVFDHKNTDKTYVFDSLQKETMIELYSFRAELLSFILDAKQMYLGNPMSLYSGDDRQEMYDTVCECYEKLRELDPSFVIPALPELHATKLENNSNYNSSNDGGGGCYVATAVYGSYDCPEVWTLRRYRDFSLAETWYGRLFIHTYYKFSPAIVKRYGETKWFKRIWKRKLDKMVVRLQKNGYESTPYNDRKW